MKTKLQMIICGLLLAGLTSLQAQQSRVMNYLPMSGGGSDFEGYGLSFLEFKSLLTTSDSLFFLRSNNFGGIRPGYISKLKTDLTDATNYPQRINFQLTNASGAIIQNLTDYVFTEAVVINDNDPTRPQQIAAMGYRGFNGSIAAGLRMPFVAVLDITEAPTPLGSSFSVNIKGRLYDLIPDHSTNICNPNTGSPTYLPFYQRESTVGIKYIPPSNQTAGFACLAVVVNGLQDRMQSCNTCPVTMLTNTAYLFQISPVVDPVSGLYTLKIDRPLDMFPGNVPANTWIASDMDVADGYLYTVSANMGQTVVTRSLITTTGAGQLPTLSLTSANNKYVNVQAATGQLGLHKMIVENGRIYLGGLYVDANTTTSLILQSTVTDLFNGVTPVLGLVARLKSTGDNLQLTNMTIDRTDTRKMVVNFMLRRQGNTLYNPALIQFNVSTNTITPIVNNTNSNTVVFNTTLNGYPEYLMNRYNSLIISRKIRGIIFTGAKGCPINFNYQNYTSGGLSHNPSSTCTTIDKITMIQSPVINLSFLNRTPAKDTDASVCQILNRIGNSQMTGLSMQSLCSSAARPVAGSGIDADDKPTQEQFLLRLNVGCSTPVGLNNGPDASYQFEINENTYQQRDRLTLNGQITEPCEMSALLLPGVSNTIISETTLQEGAYLQTERFTFIPKPASDLLVYPNPASGQITLLLNNGLGAANQPYQITDLYGKLVKSGVTNGTQYALTVDDLSTGIYQITVLDASGRPHTQRLTITR